MLKRLTHDISTGDGVVGYGVVYLYWRRCGRIPYCRSLLEYGAVDLCGRVWRCMSLLETVW